ncbi:Deoxyribodipyrimidine photo-lyase [Rickettsiales endosymbiont of Paramecium tredecaurelia]|nr:Deoxyribodipyrimidine photo-lyase [Candidatus Sarmatiella mevalonica]
MKHKIGVVCFRKDLRLHDNPALFLALQECEFVAPLYILNNSSNASLITAYCLGRAQKWWLYHSLLALSNKLKQRGLLLNLINGDPEQIFEQLLERYPINCVYWNECYDAHGIEADLRVRAKLLERGVEVKTSNASLLCEPWTIKNQANSFFKIYTPFFRKLQSQAIRQTLPDLLTLSTLPDGRKIRVKPFLLSLNPLESSEESMAIASPSSLEYFVQNSIKQLESWNLLPTKPNWAAPFRNYWEPGEDGGLQKLEEFIGSLAKLTHDEQAQVAYVSQNQSACRIREGFKSVAARSASLGVEFREESIVSHIMQYHTQRNFVAIDGTSQLSAHIHFGEVSVNMIWHMVHDLKWQITSATNCHHSANLPDDEQSSGQRAARDGMLSDALYSIQSLNTFLSQIGWREFAYHTLYYCPHALSANLRQEFDSFAWDTNQELLEKWQRGQTGYPIVDAGMRQLWSSGYMHNRTRMIVASFLTKTLIMDWRVGAQWFLDTLLDADLANNSISWQWVSGSGADAAPYFRIFNPTLQSQKFDRNGEYIRKWVPELRDVDSALIHQPYKTPARGSSYEIRDDSKPYAMPIVDYATQRARALRLYSGIKASQN